MPLVRTVPTAQMPVLAILGNNIISFQNTYNNTLFFDELVIGSDSFQAVTEMPACWLRLQQDGFLLTLTIGASLRGM